MASRPFETEAEALADATQEDVVTEAAGNNAGSDQAAAMIWQLIPESKYMAALKSLPPATQTAQLPCRSIDARFQQADPDRAGSMRR